MEIKDYKKILVLCFAQDMGVVVQVQGCNLINGSGKIRITGNVGTMAQDSVEVCKTLVANLNKNFSDFDYHLHFQYLQLKKDDPSWGLACFFLLSWLSQLKLTYSETDIAATGEIDLFGNVKPVKYLKQKLEGISRFAQCKHVVIPNTDEQIDINKSVYKISNISELIKKG